jgi:tetrahydromethanopterin S-methyltransferase subunit F
MREMLARHRWLQSGADLVGAAGIVVGAALACLAALDFAAYTGFLVSLMWR